MDEQGYKNWLFNIDINDVNIYSDEYGMVRVQLKKDKEWTRDTYLPAGMLIAAYNLIDEDEEEGERYMKHLAKEHKLGDWGVPLEIISKWAVRNK